MNFLQTLGLSIVLAMILGIVMSILEIEVEIEGISKTLMYIIFTLGLFLMRIGAEEK
jgi:hypothetical protein